MSSTVRKENGFHIGVLIIILLFTFILFTNLDELFKANFLNRIFLFSAGIIAVIRAFLLWNFRRVVKKQVPLTLKQFLDNLGIELFTSYFLIVPVLKIASTQIEKGYKNKINVLTFLIYLAFVGFIWTIK